MIIQVEVIWSVTLYSVVVEYQHFGEPCFLHLQGKMNDTRKGAYIYMDMEYKMGQSPANDRNQERTEILALYCTGPTATGTYGYRKLYSVTIQKTST
jgi:hypothetical protein